MRRRNSWIWRFAAPLASDRRDFYLQVLESAFDVGGRGVRADIRYGRFGCGPNEFVADSFANRGEVVWCEHR